MTRAQCLQTARYCVRMARLYLMQPAPFAGRVSEMQAAEKLMDALVWRTWAREGTPS